MIAALRGELLKLRTTRTFVVLVAVAVALSLVIVVLLTTLTDGITDEDAATLLVLDTTSLFVLLLGAIGMTGEWRHRTIASSLLAAPDRIRLVVAKTIAYALAGAVLSLCVTLTIAAAAAIVLSLREQGMFEAGDLLEQLGRNMAVAALLGALGVGIGAVLRNQVAAVVGILLFAFVVEPVIVTVAPEIGRFGPLSGAHDALAGTGQGQEWEASGLLSPGVGALMLAGWIVLFAGLGTLLLRQRDVT